MAMFDGKNVKIILVSCGFCLKFSTTTKLYCGLDTLFLLVLV